MNLFFNITSVTVDALLQAVFPSIYTRVPQTFSTEGHIPDIFETRGPKLTQSRWEVTVSNIGERAMLLEN